MTRYLFSHLPSLRHWSRQSTVAQANLAHKALLPHLAVKALGRWLHQFIRLVPFLVRSTRVFSEFPESALEPVIGMSVVRPLVSSTRIFFRVCLRQEIEELHLCNFSLWWLSKKDGSSKTVFLREKLFKMLFFCQPFCVCSSCLPEPLFPSSTGRALGNEISFYSYCFDSELVCLDPQLPRSCVDHQANERWDHYHRVSWQRRVAPVIFQNPHSN